MPVGSRSNLNNTDLEAVNPFLNKYSKIQSYGPGIQGVQIASRLYENDGGYRSLAEIYAPDESFADQFKRDMSSGRLANVPIIDQSAYLLEAYPCDEQE